MIKSRLAPTPSGFLHIGNLYSFVLTWLTVRRQAGELLLRIDDIDNERSRAEYLDNIFGWLNCLGISYDNGPQSSADFMANWSQQLRLHLYDQLLQQLVATGKVYACNCSRKQIAATNIYGLYNGACRHKKIGLSEPNVNWRIQVDEAAIVHVDDALLGIQKLSPALLMGDFVIRRRNKLPSYQIASLADDLHFGINYIMRGEDLLASTAAQLYLASLIHANPFLQVQFAHHPIMKNEMGEKLSKSTGTGIEMKKNIDEKSLKTIWHQIIHQLGNHLPAKDFSSIANLL